MDIRILQMFNVKLCFHIVHIILILIVFIELIVTISHSEVDEWTGDEC